jgi:hypothetical protein
MKGKGTLMDATVRFAVSLEYQEAQAWADYLKLRTREALKAWRDVRAQLRQARGAA